jgi:predicted nuclease of predicted toxin-antitoxin system
VKFLLDHDVPDDLSYLLEQLGHDVTLLRKALPRDSSDESVFRFAHEAGSILLTCNRDHFLQLAAAQPHHGIVIIIRRRKSCGSSIFLLFGLTLVGSNGKLCALGLVQL